jgi:hypothetical protein
LTVLETLTVVIDGKEVTELSTTSSEQMEIMLSDGFMVVFAAGEGSGKTHCASRWLTAKLHFDAATHEFIERDGRTVSECDLYWIIGYTYQDAYKEWKETKDACERTGILDLDSIHERDEGNDRCSFKTIYGQLVETVSGADPTNVAREEPFAIVGAEASRWDPELWDRCHGRLERKARKGSRGFFSGSFETANGAFYDWYKEGLGNNAVGLRSYNMPSWANLVVYPGGYDDPGIQRLLAKNGKDRFMERYGGLPAPPRNAVLPEFNTRLHVDARAEYSSDDDCYIFVDPGDMIYSVLFVVHRKDTGEIWVVDEIYGHKTTHALIIAEAKSREGWKYATKTRRVVIDVAGFQHHASESPAESWQKHTGFWVTGEKYPVETTVDRLRTALGVSPLTQRPRLRIHPRCKGIISEAGGGAPPYKDEGIGGLWTRFSTTGKPKRENDHSWKALGYGLQQIFGDTLPDAELYTMNDIIEDHNGFDYSYLEPTESWRFQ